MFTRSRQETTRRLRSLSIFNDDEKNSYSPQLGDGVAPSRHGCLHPVLHVPHRLRRVNREPREAQAHHRGPFLPDDRTAQPEDQTGRQHRVAKVYQALLEHAELAKRSLAVPAVAGVPLVPLQPLRDRLHLALVVAHSVSPPHPAARVLVHPRPEPGDARVRGRGEVIGLFPIPLGGLHGNLDAVHGLDVLVAEGVRPGAVHAVLQADANQLGVLRDEFHVPLERSPRRALQDAPPPVTRGDLRLARALHRLPRVRLKLGEHQAPTGLRRRVQDRRGEVSVAVGVLILAAAGAGRGEEALGGDVLVAGVVPAVLHGETARAHRSLLDVETGHGLVRHVHRAVQQTALRVVLGVEPLRVRGIELILERGRVSHRELHHAPIARELAEFGSRGGDGRGGGLEPRVRARRGPHPQHPGFLLHRVGHRAGSR
mmetsp:Transcript_6398/g.24776  ORF Transcript_6398/g.24776 Transcript_6398/m.24776 type:complete len:428 (-) Transcript_6398:617-1900(-)